MSTILDFMVESLFGGLLANDLYVPDGLSGLVDEAEAEIAHTRAVDDGAADDVAALLEGEALGHAVVHDHTPVAGEDDGLFAVQPPHGCGVGADCHADVLDVFVALHDGVGLEDGAVALVVKTGGKAEELDVEEFAIECIPGERGLLENRLGRGGLHRRSAGGEVDGGLFLDHDFHLLPVLREGGEHAFIRLGGESVADVAVGEDGVGAVGLADGLQEQPSPDEALGIRGGGFVGCRSEIAREGLRNVDLLVLFLAGDRCA